MINIKIKKLQHNYYIYNDFIINIMINNQYLIVILNES